MIIIILNYNSLIRYNSSIAIDSNYAFKYFMIATFIIPCKPSTQFIPGKAEIALLEGFFTITIQMHVYEMYTVLAKNQ